MPNATPTPNRQGRFFEAHLSGAALAQTIATGGRRRSKNYARPERNAGADFRRIRTSFERADFGKNYRDDWRGDKSNFGSRRDGREPNDLCEPRRFQSRRSSFSSFAPDCGSSSSARPAHPSGEIGRFLRKRFSRATLTATAATI